jgi:hypothetical protein
MLVMMMVAVAGGDGTGLMKKGSLIWLDLP